jgi:flagellum-specific ATP synthase
MLAAVYDRSALMIRAGLYTTGTDPEIDAAVACHQGLERFLAMRDLPDCSASFAALRMALAPARNATRGQMLR